MSEEQEKDISIDWESPTVPIVFSDTLVVRGTGHEFILYFYQLLPPVLVGTKKEQAEQLQKIGSLKAANVAAVMMSPSRIPELIDVLQRNYQNFLAEIQPSENLEE